MFPQEAIRNSAEGLLQALDLRDGFLFGMEYVIRAKGPALGVSYLQRLNALHSLL